MKININEPKEIAGFPSANCVKPWIKAGHFRTDDPMRHRKRQNVKTSDAEEDYSETGKNCMTSYIFKGKIYSKQKKKINKKNPHPKGYRNLQL